MRTLRRVVLAAVLPLAVAAATAEPAAACSCAPLDPRSALAAADGAFVGRLVESRVTDENRRRAVYVFDVENSVKGSLGERVEVHSSADGASCGLETPIGGRVGLLLSRQGGLWTSHLCAQLGPEDLLRAARPLPAPNGRGPASLLVGGRFGPARVIALDTRGRTLSYGRAGGPSVLLSGCPGGARAVEITGPLGVRPSLATWTLPRLRLVRTRPLPLSWRGITPAAVRCLDRLGRDVAVFASDSNRPAGRALLLRVAGDRVRVVWRGTAVAAGLTARRAYLSAGARGDRAVAVDLASGNATRLAPLPASTGPLAPSADGRWLAAVAYHQPLRGSASTRVVVVDLERGRTRSVLLARPNANGTALWLPSGDLAVFPHYDAAAAAVYDRSLRLRRTLPAWPARGAVLRGRTAYGTDFTGRILALDTAGGRVRVLTQLPGPVVNQVVAVPLRG